MYKFHSTCSRGKRRRLVHRRRGRRNNKVSQSCWSIGVGVDYFSEFQLGLRLDEEPTERSARRFYTRAHCEHERRRQRRPRRRRTRTRRMQGNCFSTLSALLRSFAKVARSHARTHAQAAAGRRASRQANRRTSRPAGRRLEQKQRRQRQQLAGSETGRRQAEASLQAACAVAAHSAAARTSLRHKLARTLARRRCCTRTRKAPFARRCGPLAVAFREHVPPARRRRRRLCALRLGACVARWRRQAGAHSERLSGAAAARAVPHWRHKTRCQAPPAGRPARLSVRACASLSAFGAGCLPT